MNIRGKKAIVKNGLLAGLVATFAVGMPNTLDIPGQVCGATEGNRAVYTATDSQDDTAMLAADGAAHPIAGVATQGLRQGARGDDAASDGLGDLADLRLKSYPGEKSTPCSGLTEIPAEFNALQGTGQCQLLDQ